MVSVERFSLPGFKWLGFGAGAVVLGVGLGLAGREAPAETLGLLAAMVLLAVVGLSVWPWRALDEVARDAHKTAWYWGGLGGVAIAGGPAVGLARLGAVSTPVGI